MLAVISRQSHKSVEDFYSVPESRTAIPSSQRLGQFFACGHADSRLHVELLPPDNPMRSNLREATGQHG